MRSLHCFIVEPLGGKRYSNTKDIDGSELILSSSQEDHTVTNRLAKVVGLPFIYNGPIQIGDTVVVHHNMFRIYYDMKGREKSSSNHIVDDKYYLEQDMVFLYRHDDCEWMAPSPYCFVEPIESTNDGVILSTEYEEALWGKIVYKNSDQDDIDSESIVSFTPESEYEFRFDGMRLYRMRTKNICLVKLNA